MELFGHADIIPILEIQSSLGKTILTNQIPQSLNLVMPQGLPIGKVSPSSKPWDKLHIWLVFNVLVTLEQLEDRFWNHNHVDEHHIILLTNPPRAVLTGFSQLRTTSSAPLNPLL